MISKVIRLDLEIDSAVYPILYELLAALPKRKRGPRARAMLDIYARHDLGLTASPRDEAARQAHFTEDRHRPKTPAPVGEPTQILAQFGDELALQVQ